MKMTMDELFEDPIECPICFLYYPRNINYSRCCEQPICSECFLQIKRSASGEPACCPYCVEPDFGIVYNQPTQRNTPYASQETTDDSAIISPGPASLPRGESLRDRALSAVEITRSNSEIFSKSTGRRVYAAKAKNVVSSDDVHPGILRRIQEEQRLAAEAAQQGILYSFIIMFHSSLKHTIDLKGDVDELVISTRDETCGAKMKLLISDRPSHQRSIT